MKKILTSATQIAAVCALTSLSALAQPGSGGPAPGATTSVPIDGGASLLLAGGIGYAVRKLRRKK